VPQSPGAKIKEEQIKKAEKENIVREFILG
jgi:hypothetical protein